MKLADSYSLAQVKALGNVPIEVALKQGEEHFRNMYALAEMERENNKLRAEYNSLKARHEAVLVEYAILTERMRKEGIGL